MLLLGGGGQRDSCGAICGCCGKTVFVCVRCRFSWYRRSCVEGLLPVKCGSVFVRNAWNRTQGVDLSPLTLVEPSMAGNVSSVSTRSSLSTCSTVSTSVMGSTVELLVSADLGLSSEVINTILRVRTERV
jgi:hypothetical protein